MRTLSLELGFQIIFLKNYLIYPRHFSINPNYGIRKKFCHMLNLIASFVICSTEDKNSWFYLLRWTKSKNCSLLMIFMTTQSFLVDTSKCDWGSCCSHTLSKSTVALPFFLVFLVFSSVPLLICLTELPVTFIRQSIYYFGHRIHNSILIYLYSLRDF